MIGSMERQLTPTQCSCSPHCTVSHVRPSASRVSAAQLSSLRLSQRGANMVSAQQPYRHPNSVKHHTEQLRDVTCQASNKARIGGYTPASYINFSEQPEHVCQYLLVAEVDAPVSTCFELWNDWCRLVDFLDLVNQIGLDPELPNLGLFQCYYAYGQMPVMEIVFLLKKTRVEENKRIQFETVWGMPAHGDVRFIEENNKTTVMFRFSHQMPSLLVDFSIGKLAVENHVRKIFTENLEDFAALAKTLAHEPSKAPPRVEPQRHQQQASHPPPAPSQQPVVEQQQDVPMPSASTSSSTTSTNNNHAPRELSNQTPVVALKSGRKSSSSQAAVSSQAASATTKTRRKTSTGKKKASTA